MVFAQVILNAAGVLDAKSKGEEAVRQANQDGWLQSYAIVRPGQLIGGPYDNNYYLGTLAKLDRPARSVLSWDDDKGVPQGVSIAKGDTVRFVLGARLGLLRFGGLWGEGCWVDLVLC